MAADAGWLYVLTNPAMPGLVKVGLSRRSPQHRAAELDTTGVPLPYEIAFAARGNAVSRAEAQCHARLSAHRVRDGREWFRCSVEAAAAQVVQALAADGGMESMPEAAPGPSGGDLEVFVEAAGHSVLCGRFALDGLDDGHELHSFTYDGEYLGRPDAFPLDPLNLPLLRAPKCSRGLTALGAVSDAGPDAWGRRVTSWLTGRPLSRGQIFREAVLTGSDGIGALSFGASDRGRERATAQLPTLSQVAAAANAARELEAGEELDDAARALLAGSWTIGGARPKAILRDDRPGALSDSSLIAKFEGRGSQADGRNRIEWATLEMAADMGMPVPAHQLMELGDHTALLLERFDRFPRDGRTRRRHYVSAASFVSATPTSPHLDSQYDMAFFSWRRLLDVTATVSASPAQARVAMWARLALNAALQNTDDHLKNFGFLKVDGDPVHYDIAPVFDVSPQPGDTHYLHCGDLGRHYTLSDVTDASREFKVSKKAAAEVRDRILTVLERRWDYFARAGMSERQAHAASAWIEQGCPELEEEHPTRAERPRG